MRPPMLPDDYYLEKARRRSLSTTPSGMYSRVIAIVEDARWRGAAVVTLILTTSLLVSCNNAPTGPPPPAATVPPLANAAVEFIVIQPKVVTIEQAQTQEFTFTAFDQFENPFPKNRKFTYIVEVIEDLDDDLIDVRFENGRTLSGYDPNGVFVHRYAYAYHESPRITGLYPREITIKFRLSEEGLASPVTARMIVVEPKSATPTPSPTPTPLPQPTSTPRPTVGEAVVSPTTVPAVQSLPTDTPLTEFRFESVPEGAFVYVLPGTLGDYHGIEDLTREIYFVGRTPLLAELKPSDTLIAMAMSMGMATSMTMAIERYLKEVNR